MEALAIVVSIPIAVIFLYMLARVITAAFFQSKSDYERKANGPKKRP